MGTTRSGLLACLLAAAACTDEEPETFAAPAPDLTRLSSRGLYRDLAMRQPVESALEYAPDFPLWSDGAQKRRWLILPAGTRIDTSDMSHWSFPVGTKAFKEFSMHGTLLETRLVEKIADTGDFATDYFLGTFVWSADQREATLTEGGANDVNGIEHQVPKQKACQSCHQGEPGAILGFSAVQLSRSGLITTLARQGLLSVDPGRAFSVPGSDIQTKALGVLHANCGHCHSATGAQPRLRLRILPEEIDRPVEEWELYRSTVGQAVTSEWLDHPPRFTERIRAGDPEGSAVVYRMEQRSTSGLDQMPPLATRKVDLDGVAAVRSWILRLPW